MKSVLTRGAPNQSAGLSALSAFKSLVGALLFGAALLPSLAVAQEAINPALNHVRHHLLVGDGEAARDLLLPLIWDGGSSDPAALAQLRRLVIVSYLVAGRRGDAHSAMLRYEQDYGSSNDDPAWVATKARVMIADGQADDAALVAVVSDDPEGKAVYTLALLKGYAALDEELLQEIAAALNNSEIDLPLRRDVFAAALEKGVAVSLSSERIAVLQRLLMLPRAGGVSVSSAVDGLWIAYGEYGQVVANRLQLLVGDSAPWFEAAARLQQSEPSQALALYAWLAFHGESGEYRAKAHESFAALLLAQPEGEQLLYTLHLDSSRYSDLRQQPLAVAAQLAQLYRSLLRREIERRSPQH